MIFWLIMAFVVAGFGIGFYAVKSGRLTIYMLALDGVLIKAEPIFDAVTGYDFAAMMSPAQQGWLVLTATVLAGLARKRRVLREKMGFVDPDMPVASKQARKP